jgi:hypothetical protein
MKANYPDIVDLNFEDRSLPEAVRMFRPVVWHDEFSICVLLGSDPEFGVFGCGDTLEKALNDWSTNLEKEKP